MQAEHAQRHSCLSSLVSLKQVCDLNGSRPGMNYIEHAQEWAHPFVNMYSPWIKSPCFLCCRGHCFREHSLLSCPTSSGNTFISRQKQPSLVMPCVSPWWTHRLCVVFTQNSIHLCFTGRWAAWFSIFYFFMIVVFHTPGVVPRRLWSLSASSKNSRPLQTSP